MKKILALLLALCMMLACVACNGADKTSTGADVSENDSLQEEVTDKTEDEEPETVDAILDLSQQLEAGTYEWELSADGSYYALKNVQYCANPTDPEGENLLKQCMSIYVPAAYLNEDGTFNDLAEINGYTAASAPIVYKNGVSGYSEATPIDPDAYKEGSGLYSYYWSDNQAYLEHGYIIVSPGSRGKETTAQDGTFVGKSPAALVDLKAGIRFLKYNADALPGDTDKIISMGMSAGGAVSALIGSTGNNSIFDSYLKEIGAVIMEGIGDDVYAAISFCPIADLNNADMAYEWCFGSDTSWRGAYTEPAEGELNDFQKALSADLADAYIEYLNSLNLGLTLDSARSGDYYDTLMGYLSDSLNDYLETNYGSITSNEAAAYVSSVDAESGKVDFTDFAALNQETGRYEITDLDAYVTNYRGRMKMCPAFDNLLLSESENHEFGDATTYAVHFAPEIYKLLATKDYSALVCEDYNYSYSAFSF